MQIILQKEIYVNKFILIFQIGLTNISIHDIILHNEINVRKRGDLMRIYLKELRNKFQLTQEETANRLGISQNYYSMIEKGERQQNMRIDFLKNLAKVFNVSIDWVIKQENKLETR